MAYLNGKPHGDLCLYCNKICYCGEWRNVDEIDQKLMPSEIKNTICQNCSFERFPKFYMGENSSNGRRTKRNVKKFFSIFKKRKSALSRRYHIADHSGSRNDQGC